MKLDDVLAPPFDDAGRRCVDLAKLAGKRILRVEGEPSTQSGEEWDEVFFQLFRIVFEDGSAALCEGSHDFPYLSEVPGVSEARMLSLQREIERQWERSHPIRTRRA